MYLLHLKVQSIEGSQSGEGEHLKDRFPLLLSMLPSPGINVTRLLGSLIAANGNTAWKVSAETSGSVGLEPHKHHCEEPAEASLALSFTVYMDADSCGQLAETTLEGQ